MALFWHHVFATGDDKVSSAIDMDVQRQMFRDRGMENFPDLLLELAQNPAMIFWLDNQENHKRAPNENWGRELMELFSLGVGSYTEKDVFECARAIKPKIPGFPCGAHPWGFEYRPEDHDHGEKVNSGVLINRVNFVADHVRDTDLPGVQNIIGRVAAEVGASGDPLEVLVQRCLYEMAPLEVEEAPRTELEDHARSLGPVTFETSEPTPERGRLQIHSKLAGSAEPELIKEFG